MGAAGTGEREPEAGSTYERRRTSFGGGGGPGEERVAAAEYDAVRPDWPPETIAWLLGDPAPGTRLTVVDLGAGTGKGTRTLARLGHAVVAIEPSAGMRSVLRKSLADVPEAQGYVQVRAGDAEHLPLPDGGVDAVVVLQAWHWFDQDVAARECARVLRPGGLLSLAWHQREESLPWARELSEAVRRSEYIPHNPRDNPRGYSQDNPGGDPQGNEGDGEPDDDELSLPSDFLPAQQVLRRWTMRQSVDDLVRHAATWSFVAVSPDREQILRQVRDVASRAADGTGSVEIPMTTSCYRARRR